MQRDGLNVWVTADRFAVQADGRELGAVPLLLWRRYVRPADLHRLPASPALIVLDRATSTTLDRLEATGRAWATLDGRFSLPTLDRHEFTAGLPDPIASRRPPGTADELAALVHAMPGATHAEYAAALGVTRARVTQLLHGAAARPPVRPVPTAGHVSRWWSDRKPWEQVQAVYEWLDANGCHPVIGGETAADVIVPWHTPRSTVVHARKIVPPPPGFVLADSPEDATVTVVVDYRPSPLAAARLLDTPAGKLRVAHPLHVAGDLSDEAARDPRTAEQVAALLAAPAAANRTKDRAGAATG